MDIRKHLIRAIEEAEKALHEGNYPFGAVVVDASGEVVATGRNENFSTKDISAHAEIQCLRKVDIGGLLDATKEYYLFTSGEPCGGCSFFIAKTKSIKHVCWALTDPQKAGYDDLRTNRDLAGFFENIEVAAEPFADLKEQSSSLLRQYYEKLDKPEKAKLY